MSIITQDALKAITEQLSPTSRLNLAAVDSSFFDVATKWHDVKTIVFDDEDVTLAGANMVHTYENSTFQKKEKETNRLNFKTESRETALKLCPALKKLIIQCKLTDCDSAMLIKLNSRITKLYISTENLSLVNFPKFEKLRTLHLVYNSTKELKVVDVVEPRVLNTAFPQTLTRICLTGIYLTENLLTYMAGLKNLMCLDTIGCLVDTRVGAKYIPLFETYPTLEELSLPPSLFSFSVKSKTPAELSLQKLKVTKIGIYMDQFDDDMFTTQCHRLFSKNLKYLVVFGNYLQLKRWKQLGNIKHFMILFGPNTALASCPQANLTNVKLLSHLVRSPPYIPLELSPTFLRNHDTNVGNLSWQFSLIEWKDSNSCRKEVVALRKQMNATEAEEVVFEGLRIPAPVIIERFGQRRMTASPNGFQVFDIPNPPPLPARQPAAPQATAPPTRPRARRPGRSLRRIPHPPGVRRPSRRRHVSAPPQLAIENSPARPRRQSDSMRTQPPSPVRTQTGAALNATLPSISPIGNTTASRIGGTVTPASAGTSVLNRGFVVTPGTSTASTMGSSESRRLSTTSQVSSGLNTATASPERLPPASTTPAAQPPQQGPQNNQVIAPRGSISNSMSHEDDTQTNTTTEYP